MTLPETFVAELGGEQLHVERRRDLMRRIIDDRLSVIGLSFILFFALIAVSAPLLAPQNPDLTEALRRLEGPSLVHPLGTDNLGRDLLSRLIYGSRWSLGAVALATLLIMTIGVTVGSIAGYYGGLIDGILMRIVDVLLAFPSLLLVIAIAGTLGSGIFGVIIGLVSVWWASYARLVRGMVLAMREREFIAAARSLGVRESRIILRHILPNVLPPVAILATVEMGELIVAVAGLGFLGLGAQPPAPEWGTMVNDGRPFLFSAPQLMIYPGLAISLAVIGFNLLGDGLRDMLDPRTSARWYVQKERWPTRTRERILQAGSTN
jgi:ABC-type dipeptide/oligopeptide/nickel transport system permease subunit